MALLFWVSAYKFHADGYRVLIAEVLSFYLLTITIIDFQHKIIPDELSLSLLFLGLCLSFHNPYFSGSPFSAFVTSFLAAFIGGGSMFLLAWLGEKMFKREALGGGDIKFMAGIGAFLGWGGLFGSFLLGSLSGGLFGGVLLLLKKKSKGETIPFGPFLSLGAYVTCLFPAWWHLFIFP